MTEWLYRATKTKVGYEATRNLALDDGFLCRAAFEKNLTQADNAAHVRVGDIVHFYFSGDGARTCIGSFEVVDPSGHAAPERFSGAVEGTHLRAVTDPELIAQLGQLGGVEGYAVDPKLSKRFTRGVLGL